MSSTRKTLEHLGPAYYLPVNAAAAAAAAAEAAAAAKAAKVAAAATATAAKAAAAATTVTAAKAAAAAAEVAEVASGFGGGGAAAAEGVQAAIGAGGTAFESGAIIDITSVAGRSHAQRSVLRRLRSALPLRQSLAYVYSRENRNDATWLRCLPGMKLSA